MQLPKYEDAINTKSSIEEYRDENYLKDLYDIQDTLKTIK